MWPKTTLLLPVWPKDAKRMDTSDLNYSQRCELKAFLLKISFFNWPPSVFHTLNVCCGHDLLSHQNHWEQSCLPVRNASCRKIMCKRSKCVCLLNARSIFYSSLALTRLILSLSIDCLDKKQRTQNCSNDDNTVVPPYPQRMCSKSPRRSLKSQILPNPIYTVLFYPHVQRILWRVHGFPQN